MKTVYPIHQPPHRQRGAVTLFVALVALVFITIMTVYTASVGVMDQRMSGNELRHQQAEAAAEAGLNQAVAYFKAKPTTAIAAQTSAGAGWSTAQDIVPAAITLPNGAQVQWARAFHCTQALVTTICPTPKDAAGAAVTTPYNYNVFRAQGTSSDGTGTVQVEQQIAFAANIAAGGAIPNAALTAAGIVPMGGNYNVVANPNGGGPGVPVSVWSHSSVSGGGSASTCNQSGYDSQTSQCTSDQITSGGTMGLDVVQNDPYVSAGGRFPDDVFQYFFGVSADPTASPPGWQTVYNMAQQITDCSTLGPTSGGLIWYTGSLCDLPSNTTIGAATDDPATTATEGPVILVAQDANFKMNANTVFNGVIFLFSTASPPVSPGSVLLNGGPVVNGAFLANSGLDNLSGTYTVKYDASILAQLAPAPSGNNNNPINGHPADVPGSWRDF